MNLLDMLNQVGSRVRYGVSPEDKYKLMLSKLVPGQPEPFMPGGAEPNPEAERYLSNYLGTQQWGKGPTTLFNHIRYLMDDNSPAYAAGLRAAETAQRGSPLAGLMATLASGASR